MKKDFCVTVLFGSDQVRKFNNDGIFTNDEISQYTKFYEFETEQELNAFVLGIEEANGWLDLLYFKNTKLYKPGFTRIIQHRMKHLFS